MHSQDAHIILFILVVSCDWLKHSTPAPTVQDFMRVKHLRGEYLLMLQTALRLAHRRLTLLVLRRVLIMWWGRIVKDLVDRSLWLLLLSRDTTTIMFDLILWRLQDWALTHAEWGHLIVRERILLAVVPTPHPKFVHDFVESSVDGRVECIEVISELLKFFAMMLCDESKCRLLLL